MDIGFRIREYRKSAGLTQVELADKLGITHAAVTSWEKGRSKPTYENLEKVADALSVPFIKLVAGADKNYDKLFIPDGAIPMDAKDKPGLLPFRKVDEIGSEKKHEVPLSIARDHLQGFLLEIDNDSMNNVFTKDSLVVVDPDLNIKTGDIGAYSFNGELFVRRVLIGKNTVVLSPESTNQEYEDIVLKSTDAKSFELGRVVWFQAAKEL